MSTRELVVAGVRTRLLSEGEGEPIVLLHGLGASAYSWRRLQPALSRAGRAVYAPDLPGFGRSEAPEGFDYSFLGFMSWVEALLDALKLERADFVGNSMGGVISLRTAMERPARVRRLVLLGAPVYPHNRPMLLWPMRWPLLGALYERSLGPWAIRFIAKSAFVDHGLITEELIEEYGFSLKRPGGRRAVAEFIRRAIPPDADALIRRYASLEHPTLVVRGECDGVVDRASAERFAREIKRGTFLHIPRCGHAPQEESPEPLLAALRDFFQAHG